MTVLDKYDFPNYVETIPVASEDLVKEFNFSFYWASQAWFRGTYSDKQKAYTTELFRQKMGDWRPDIIISSSQVPFLVDLYSEAAVLYFEVGMTSRPPFSLSFYLDPAGLYKYGFPATRYDDIQGQPLEPQDKTFIENYRNFFLPLIKSKNPLTGFIDSYQGKFDSVILVPLQIEGFWFNGNCEFESQIHLLHKLLESTPSRIGVLAVPHPDAPCITPVLEQYFKSKYPNFIFSPEIQTVASASQYLIDSSDAVLSVTSMVGLQSLIWKKKLFAIGETQLKVAADYCFKSDLSDVGKLPELLKAPSVEKDHILNWLLTHFYIPQHYFFKPNWLCPFIMRLTQAIKGGCVDVDIFKQIDEPDQILSHLLEEAVLDIPRFLSSGPDRTTFSLKEKEEELEKKLETLREIQKSDAWQIIIKKKYNEPLTFTGNKSNIVHLQTGWSHIEDWGVWSQGYCAEIVVSLPPNKNRDIVMHTVYQAFVTENHPVQIVDVLINDEKRARWEFHYGESLKESQVLIPSSLIAASPTQTHIFFKLFSPASPASLGLSTDLRLLGIGLVSLKFSYSSKFILYLSRINNEPF